MLHLSVELTHLKKEVSNNNGYFLHFRIFLNNGCASSGMRISYNGKYSNFYIIHEIEESFEESTEVDFMKNSIIMQALDNQCLFKSDL